MESRMKAPARNGKVRWGRSGGRGVGRLGGRVPPVSRGVGLVLALLLLSPPPPARAQGWVEPDRLLPGSWVQRVDSKVRVEVKGNTATVVVDEWFQAHGRGLGEADYLFPLPSNAVFRSFSLYQGGEELRGEVIDADEARRIYEEIVRKRRDPALIELAGNGLFRARIFPLNPGETRRVTLRFTQLLERAGDALHLRYAGGVPTSQRCAQGGSAPPTPCGPSDAPVSFEVLVPQGDRFLAPFSPTHPLRVVENGPGLTIHARGEMKGPFSLFLPLARDGLGLTLLTHSPLGEDGYFLLSLSPGRGDAPPELRDMTVVVDVSGSMSGEKIRQAREALLDLLDSLEPQDRFRLIAFSNAVRPYDLNWTHATPEALGEARGWLSALEAEGGTNMAGALEEALRVAGAPERLPMTVFLTDGLPTVGETSVEAIRKMVKAQRGRFRVFSFGVGNDVNTALLDGMAEEGRGSTNYVAPGESVERALSLLSMKIKHPVLTELALADAPVRISEIYPAEIPDVFAGEELVLFGRYETVEGRGSGRGALTVEGRRGGKREHFTLDAEFPTEEEANNFIPRLWASRKLGFLSRKVWTEGESPDLVEEIRRTALRYGLPSPYTSYLVLEAGASGGGLGPDVVVSPTLFRNGSRARPAAPTQGAEAVARARGAKALRDVSTMGELLSVEEEVQGPSTSGEVGGRMVAGRLFREQDGVWMQAGLQEGVHIQAVAPFSRAYFDLLNRIPELRLYAQAFTQFEVQGDRLRIRVVEGGVETLSHPRVEELRDGFLRGGDGVR